MRKYKLKNKIRTLKYKKYEKCSIDRALVHVENQETSEINMITLIYSHNIIEQGMYSNILLRNSTMEYLGEDQWKLTIRNVIEIYSYKYAIHTIKIDFAHPEIQKIDKVRIALRHNNSIKMLHINKNTKEIQEMQTSDCIITYIDNKLTLRVKNHLDIIQQMTELDTTKISKAPIELKNKLLNTPSKLYEDTYIKYIELKPCENSDQTVRFDINKAEFMGIYRELYNLVKRDSSDHADIKRRMVLDLGNIRFIASTTCYLHKICILTGEFTTENSKHILLIGETPEGKEVTYNLYDMILLLNMIEPRVGENRYINKEVKIFKNLSITLIRNALLEKESSLELQVLGREGLIL